MPLTDAGATPKRWARSLVAAAIPSSRASPENRISVVRPWNVPAAAVSSHTPYDGWRVIWEPAVVHSRFGLYIHILTCVSSAMSFTE